MLNQWLSNQSTPTGQVSSIELNGPFIFGEKPKDREKEGQVEVDWPCNNKECPGVKES